MRWARPKRMPIGVDVGTAAIKAAQLTGGVDQPRLAAALILPRREPGAPLDEKEVARLTEALHRQGFQGRDLVLAAPPDKTFTTTVNVPPAKAGAPWAQIARNEVARIHQCDPAAIEVEHWPLPETNMPGASGKSGATATVLTVACPHSDANALLDLFESSRFVVRGLDVAPLALVRAAQPLFTAGRREDAKSIFAVVDLGAKALRMTVLLDDVIVYERTLSEFGLIKLREQLAQKLMLEQDVVDYVLRDVGLENDEEDDGAASQGRDAASHPPGAADESSKKSEANDAQSHEGDEASNEDGDRRTGKRGRDILEAPDAMDAAIKEPRRMIAAHADAVADEMQVAVSYALQQYRDAEVASVVLTGGGAAIPHMAEHLIRRTELDIAVASPCNITSDASALPPALVDNPALAGAIGLAMYEL